MEEILDNDVDQTKFEFKFQLKIVFLWAGFILLALIFEARSWAGSSILWLSSTAGMTGYNLSSMFALKGKNTLNTALLIGGIIWTCYLFWGMLFNSGIPFNFIGIIFYLLAMALVLFIYEYVKRNNKKEWIKNNS